MRKLLLFLAFTSVMIGYSQTGYLDVDAGADVTGNCGQPQNLTATYNDVKVTTNYTVATTPYVLPADFTTGTVPTGLTSDDKWSTAVDIGFDFCYFGNTYSQIVIGSNAEISFNAAYAGGTNHYDLSDGGVPITLPQPSDDSDLGFNTIFGPGIDINPATCGTIKYELIGIAPTRALVVKYDDMCYFGSSCTSLRMSSMIVIYESTNIIDVYIKEKPICSSWNNGYALVGINNIDGTVAVIPPGRNTSVWPATDEAWRFTPDGASATSFEWTDPSGTILATTPNVTVTPFMTTIYTATATYTNCNGDVVTMSDSVEASTSLDGPLEQR